MGDRLPPTRSAVKDWGLDDPKGQPIERVREIRDDIQRRAQDLVRQLGVERSS